MSRAAAYALVADLLFAMLDGIIKSVASRYPIVEVAFLRFAFGSFFAILLVVYVRPGWPSRETVTYNALRSVLVVVTATTFFYALSVLGFAETVALSFLSPIFMVLFGALLLGETVDRRVLAGLAAGFAGMLVMVLGRLDLSVSVSTVGMAPQVSSGIVAVLVSAVSYALVMVLLRVRATRDAREIIVLFQNIGPLLMLAIPASLVWVGPSGGDLVRFALIGVLGVAGHVLMARAFAEAEAARLAPLHYLTLVWSVLFGYLFFSETPSMATILGGALIVVGTLVTQRR